MDILIKNIEMPKDNKRIFLCIEKDGEVGVFEEKKLIRFTEAHELPPHGRLCDLDSLIEHETYNIEQALFDSDEVLEDLKNAPVIVEATE